jgi:aspartyl-tRNA(Asn)/glutamyl-tRNA(Gln) amidotransferase subunit A
VTPLSRSLDHVGPMANSVEDAFTMLEAISEFRRAPAARPRILLPEPFFFEQIDPEVERLVRAGAAGLGTTESVDLGDVQRVWDANTTILLSDAAAFHEERVKQHADWFGGSMAERMMRGFDYRAIDYARARDVQREWIEQLTRVLGDDAVLALPGSPVPATPIGNPEGSALSRVLTRITAPFNLAGVPVLTVPVGRVGSLPVGMQIVAAPGRESVLWTVGRDLDAALVPEPMRS